MFLGTTALETQVNTGLLYHTLIVSAQPSGEVVMSYWSAEMDSNLTADTYSM